MKRLVWLVCLMLLVACGRDDNAPITREFTPPEVTDEIRDFRRAAEALQRRPEHTAPELGLQQILIAVRIEGPGESRPRLSLPEAEAKAAEVLRLAQAGEDFDDLILRHSYDGLKTGQRTGTEVYVREGNVEGRGPSVLARSDLPKAVGDAAWRLEPGEIGAVERHHRDANEGYYVLRRLTDAELLQDDPANFETDNPAIRAMRDSANELMARAELDVERVTIRHILIARFARGNAATRDYLNEAEAEAKAAEVFATALQTDDFAALVESETYDSLDGTYRLAREGAELEPGEHAREHMVAHFWQAAWRLQPGEVGVILYNRANSPYGYHIIKRLD